MKKDVKYSDVPKKLVAQLKAQEKKDTAEVIKLAKTAVLKALKDSVGTGEEKIHVLTFEREDMNEVMSTSCGFGFQDLKPAYKQVLIWMMNEFSGKVSFLPGASVSVKVYITL